VHAHELPPPFALAAPPEKADDFAAATPPAALLPAAPALLDPDDTSAPARLDAAVPLPVPPDRPETA
jgi:hypothetical protein